MPRWIRRGGMAAFTLALLYPLSGLFSRVGPWRWDADVANPTLASIRVSLVWTAAAMLIVVVAGTPVAMYVARTAPKERLWWQSVLILSILLPPLALGILLSMAFGPSGWIGHWLDHAGIRVSNNALAFVVTQVYVSVGYYVLGAIAAFGSIPPMLEKQAALLGQPPWKVFWRVSFPWPGSVSRLPSAWPGFAPWVSLEP